MPAISTTTLDVLEDLLVTVIEAIDPRIQYQRDARWKHYAKGKDTASRTRSFTVRWVPRRQKEGGYFTNSNVEIEATLVVRTDYSGQHEELTAMVQNDWGQLRDRLNTVTADITSGLVSILQTTASPPLASDTAQGRTRLSERSASNTNTFQIDHTFDLTYMQARA